MARCPACGSSDLRRTPEGPWACNACDARFDAPAADPVTPPPPGDDRGAWWLPLGLVAGLVVLLFALAPGTRPTPVDPADVVAEPGDPDLDAEISGTSRGALPDGGAFWLFHYVNRGTKPIARPSAELRLLDGEGHVVKAERATARVPDVLEPGERVGMRIVLPDPPEHVTTELRVVPPTEARRPRANVRLGVRGVMQDPASGVISGEVFALGDVAAQVVGMQVTGVRNDGRIVAWAASDLGAVEVLPDHPVPFRASVTESSIDPVAWRAEAWGVVPAEPGQD